MHKIYAQIAVKEPINLVHTEHDAETKYSNLLTALLNILLTHNLSVCLSVCDSTALCWTWATLSVSSSIHSQWDSLDGGSGRRKPVAYTQDSTNTEWKYSDSHSSSGIRTHNPSVREDEDSSCLRPRGHSDRPYSTHTHTHTHTQIRQKCDITEGTCKCHRVLAAGLIHSPLGDVMQ
jgi:hypothetical protein